MPSSPALLLPLCPSFPLFLAAPAHVLRSLTGAVWMQVFMYFRTYPVDSLRNRLTVSPRQSSSLSSIHSSAVQVVSLWYVPNCRPIQVLHSIPGSSFRTLDMFHTCLVCAAVWTYLISNFGNVDIAGFIPWYASPPVCVRKLTLFIRRTISVRLSDSAPTFRYSLRTAVHTPYRKSVRIASLCGLQILQTGWHHPHRQRVCLPFLFLSRCSCALQISSEPDSLK